jgi:hypothetical protein
MSPHDMALAYLGPMRGLEEDPYIFPTVLELCTNDLEKGTEVTLALIAASNNEAELCYVAAGPVEDLLKWHGTRAIPALEAAADQSEKVRQALAAVWLNETHEAFCEWRRLLSKYGVR